MGLRRAPAAVVAAHVLAAVVLCATPVAGAPALGARGEPVLDEKPASRSLGFPWRGRLENGALLRERREIRYVQEYRAAGRFFGTDQLVGMLERAADRVWRARPGAPLAVGDLSAEGGGRVSGHHSHRNGRDADIAFYAKGPDGAPFVGARFVKFWATGRGAGPHREVVFDDARNWLLVQALVEDPEARVQFIFVSETLRWRLLRTGARAGAPSETLARAATVLRRPSGRHRHKNHFHVRIFCPERDRPGCRDRGPFWSWYEGEPPYGLTMPTRRPPWLREGRVP